MKTKYLVVVLFSLLFILFSFHDLAAAQANDSSNKIYQCGTLDNPGIYTFNQSITAIGSCLNITSSGVYINCNGSSITYGTGGGPGVIGVNASTKPFTNLSIKSCFVTKASAGGADGWGIQFNRTSDSLIFNNTIKTNGTATNYGIFISINSFRNNITQNVIIAKGSGANNMGIFLARGASSTTVSLNNISTFGTTTNYGIYVLGNATFNNSNNAFSDNNITTWGTGASDYGIFITSNSSLNTINRNNITTSGTSTNYGIYIIGTAALNDDNNNIFNNFIQTFGSTTDNYGIYITTNSSNNNITSNDIITNGTTKSYGIWVTTNSSNNNISNNDIIANGTTTTYGIYISGAAGSIANNNTLDNNTVQTKCQAAASSCYGISLQSNVYFNNITKNNISTNGTTNNWGIYFIGTAALAVNYNLISLNNITTNGIGASNHGIYFITNVSYNNITGNNITVNGTTTNNGIYIYGDTATTPSNSNIIADNTIQAYGNSTGLPADYSDYGIYLRSLANQNVIINNNITARGTTTNYGIYLAGTAALTENNNIISNNFVQALGTTYRNNYGIYIVTNTNQNNVTNNVVITNGTTGNIGIYLSGATNISNGNLIYNNTIFTNGTTGSHGIYITTNSSNNNISGNNIMANGTGTNYGINLVGVANGPTNNNTIANNTIQTRCSTNSNYGVYLLTNANQNNISNNTINTSGATDNYGIAVSGTTVPSISNNILYNEINTNGTTNNWGIYFTANANQNDIIGNDIITNGTTTAYGIYFLGAAGTSVNNNTIDNNSIQAKCQIAASNCYGIWLRRLTSYNNITRNNIITSGTTLNYGIYLIGTNALIVNSNLIDSNSIITSGTGISNHGIILSTNASYNAITNNIILANGSNTNYGINVVGAATADSNSTLIDSNNITVVGTAAAVSNIGIWIDSNASNSNITNNNVSVYGTSNSQGIELRGAVGTLCTNNLISSNNILVNASAAASVTDYGIYFTANTNSNIITSNNITTTGNTTGYGIYLVGGAAATPANSNIISYNNITTIGRGPSNYGVFLSSNANYNDITDNVISTSGKSTNYGIYLTGTAPFTVNSNEIDSNTIQTLSNETSNYGIYLLTNANQNNLTNNTITTNGTISNMGIVLSGVTNLSNGNLIYNNSIFTNGTTGNHGIYITTNSSSNNVSGNSILANGTVTNYGIYLLSIANAQVDNNTLDSNIIRTKCSGVASNCSGLFLQNNVDLNNITKNNITTYGTKYNYGIYLFGTAALNLNLNLIDSNFISTASPFDNGIYLSAYSNSTVSSNTINVSYADRIVIDSTTSNNNISRNSFINRNYSYYDFNFTSAGNNATLFIDQYAENYTFPGMGDIIDVKDSQYGEIDFIVPVNKSGTNFSNDIVISSNSAYVNSAQTGLNRGANITLYNLPVNFSYPAILKNGDVCSAGACYNFTSLNAGNVSFNVSSWSTYSIGEMPDLIPPTITFESPTSENSSTVSSSTQTIVASIYDNSDGNTSSFIDFDRSLVGYWAMDYYNSTGIYDNSSYGNFATFFNGSSTSNILGGIRGNAIDFDGNNSRLRANPISLNQQNFSVFAWIYKKGNTNTYIPLVEQGGSSTFRLIYYDTRLCLGNDSDEDNFYCTPYDSLHLDNQWYLVGGVVQNGVIKLYANETSLNYSQRPGNYGPTYDNSLYIGGRDYTINVNSWNGSIDEVMVFNRSLSQSEISALYNSKVNKFNASFSNLTEGQHNYTVYAVDEAGNMNNSGLRNFIVKTSTCSCPGLDSNWQINMADFCNIAADCNLGSGNITFIGNGWTIFNATISFNNLKYPSAGQVLLMGSNAKIKVG